MPESPAINLTNQFLIAMPGMVDDNFAGAVVYLCEHNDKGALGLIINKPIELEMRDLFDKVSLPFDREDLLGQPVLMGGPVQQERGFVLHQALGDTPEAGYNASLKIPGGLEMTTSRDVLEAMSQGAGPSKVVIMLGYAGWTPGQLEQELANNGWLTVDADQAIIFDTPVEQRYDRALSLLGIERSFLMSEAGHA
jgi:putative transcriptional regulator